LMAFLDGGLKFESLGDEDEAPAERESFSLFSFSHHQTGPSIFSQHMDAAVCSGLDPSRLSAATYKQREREREREREMDRGGGRWREGGGASSHRKMLTCAVARYLSGSVRSAERGRIHCCCGGMRQSVSVTLMPGILFRLRRCRERSNDLKTGFAYECTGAASPSKRESSLAAVVDRRELLGCHRRREFHSPVSLQKPLSP